MSRRSETAEGVGTVVDDLVRRLESRLPDTRQRLIDRYREEIVDYQGLPESTLEGDIAQTATSNVRELLNDLRSGTSSAEPEGLESFRRSAVRRARQGVSFSGLLHAYRLWGEVVWEELLDSAGDDPAEREALIWIAGRVMAHVDAVSTAVAQAYLDEMSGVWGDRRVMRRDLLEVLISGRAARDRVDRQVAALGITLAEINIVVLARQGDATETSRSALRAALDLTTEHLSSGDGAPLVGIRDEELVAICPAETLATASAVDRRARALAAELGTFAVALGRRHRGLEGIATSYHEAHEALDIAIETAATGRAVAFSDVLLDHMLRSSPYSEALLEETVKPIIEYDQQRTADLLPTLRAYFDSGFNLTRSATTLFVHPNTVVYRLQRIKALTGRDPSDPNDLLLLILGLKFIEPGRKEPAPE